jgi:DNA-binding NarL/FixJ family response regulator
MTMSRSINVIVVETSEIVFEGLNSILTSSGRPYNIQMADSLREVEQINLKNKADIVLINPLMIQNQLKEFGYLKKELYDVRWIGLVYSYFDQKVLSDFDEVIYINDKPNRIIAAVQKLISNGERTGYHTQVHESLTERESDVLRLLVAGNANKAIADKLNISTHTVISHRKNITMKTGIKSVSGLTIYAVVNNLLSLDDYRE